MDTQQEAYKAEAFELLGELETSLLELEERPDDADLIDRVFRAMHTIKGSGSMFGFEAIAAFTHEAETAFDLVREGRIKVTRELIELALQARDQIKAMLSGEANPDEEKAIMAGFRGLFNAKAHPEAGNKPADHAALTPGSRKAKATGGPPAFSRQLSWTTYRIRFAPRESLFQNGTNPLLLLEELMQMGHCCVIAQTDRLPDISAFDPEACYLYWDVILTTSQGLDAIKDVFIFVEDECKLDIKMLVNSSGLESPEATKRIGEILLEKGDLSAEEIGRALTSQRRLGEILVESRLIDPRKVESALLEQEHVKAVRRQQETVLAASSVRVAADKLDSLVDLVGELVTVQARLSQKAGQGSDPELLAIAEIVSRLTAEMRDNTLSIRMLPIGATFNKLRRLVRDLSKELGKDVVLETEGGETELDKTVIEQLNDPLVHIIRNCIDHGIEAPGVRTAAGKPLQGTIRLSAEHSGANVLIHIRDDGAGLDVKAIRRKAVEKGLLAQEAEKDEQDLMNLIVAPGFSTATSVSSISGRGVGMDVVKRGIESLRGAISIDSRPGHGMKISLKLPLTLAIIDGLLVEIGGDKYVFPLHAIEECVELTRREVERCRGRKILNIRGKIVPYIHLREHFGIHSPSPEIEQVVINEVNGQRNGLVVDRVIGEHQIVIKTMSKLYDGVEEISGATILGDGSVALILDIQKLLQSVDSQALAA